MACVVVSLYVGYCTALNCGVSKCASRRFQNGSAEGSAMRCDRMRCLVVRCPVVCGYALICIVARSFVLEGKALGAAVL